MKQVLHILKYRCCIATQKSRSFISSHLVTCMIHGPSEICSILRNQDSPTPLYAEYLLIQTTREGSVRCRISSVLPISSCCNCNTNLADHPISRTRHLGTMIDKPGRTVHPSEPYSSLQVYTTYLTAWSKVLALS